MASAKGGKKSKDAKRSKAATRAARAKSRRLRHEKAKSKKLGYSLTYARRKRERAASKRFVETAKKLSPYVPELKKLSKKKRLTTAEKAKITRYNKTTRHFLGSLHAIPKGKKKAFKGVEFSKGVNAISLNNFSSNATVSAINDDIIVVSNGRTWLLWKLDKAVVRNKNGELDAAARKAFNAQFPLEVVGALAEKAFKELKVERVALWISSGRTDRTFETIGAFLRYLHTRLHAGMYNDTVERQNGPDIKRKTDAGDFINGLAIELVEPPKEAPKHVKTAVKTQKKKIAKQAAKRKQKRKRK